MKIVFFFDDDRYVRLAEAAAGSAKRFMPHVPTVQLCGPTMAARRVKHIDEVVVIEDASAWVTRRRWAGQAQLDGELLFADVDCIFRADVSGVFEQPFDLAVPRIDDPNWRASAGVVFSRSQAFWRTLAASTVPMRPADTMLEEQLAAFNTAVDFWPGKVLRLPHEKYERLPRNADDPCEGAAIVHYRGPRKKWMRLA